MKERGFFFKGGEYGIQGIYVDLPLTGSYVNSHFFYFQKLSQLYEAPKIGAS